MKEETLEGLLKRIENDALEEDLVLRDSASITPSALKLKDIFYKIASPTVTYFSDGRVSDPLPSRDLSMTDRKAISRAVKSNFYCLKSLYNALPKHTIRPYAMVEDSDRYYVGYLVQYLDGNDLGEVISTSYDKLSTALEENKATYRRVKSKIRREINQIKGQMDEIIKIMRKNNLAHGDLHEGNIMRDKAFNLIMIDPKIFNPTLRRRTLEWRQENDIMGRERIFCALDDTLRYGVSD
jgi:hypothetical protein